MAPNSHNATDTPSGSGGVVSSLIAGRYRLAGLLGSGGMADVYAAHDERLDRPVAIKLFRPGTGLQHQDARQRSEISLLARLNHPNLVMVLDAGTALPDPPRDPAEITYLVMEFVDGRTLADEIEQRALPPSLAADIGRQLADALGYIHAAGIVHRDVKPANVLTTSRGLDGEVSVKLSDFGIARMLDDTRLTVEGTLGTANYLSPEQATGAEVGPASDVYSLALVLLEALTGRIVYPGNGVAAAAARLHREPDIPATVPGAWATLLRHMLERDPAQRPSAAQVGKTLRELSVMPQRDLAGAAMTMPLPPNSPPAGALPRTLHAAVTPGYSTDDESKPRRRRLWIAAGAGLIILIAVIATVSALSNSGAGPESAPPLRSGAARHTPASHVSTSSPTHASNPRSVAHRPANAAQAINALRAAIAHAARAGNLDGKAASDLDKKLADLDKSITTPKPAPGKGPAPGDGPAPPAKPSDASKKVDDLLHHLDDLSKAGQLTGAGRRQIVAALTAVERFIPQQR